MDVPPDILVKATNLTKQFSDFWHRPKLVAVNSISFSIKRGQIFGLLGPNGSGKSTTIKMMLGLLKPTTGTLDILGRQPSDVEVKKHIGYLPEESYLYKYLSAEETLNFYGKLFDIPDGERKHRTDQLLRMVGLAHARKRAVGEFSKGMARRVGLAQALINDPELIILDEPTSGLDPLGTRQVKDLILELGKRGKTVILSSHLLADVEDVCDDILILYNGNVCAEGSMKSLLSQPDKQRITFPALPDHELSQLLEVIQKETGGATMDTPQKNLEQFFIEVVEKAKGMQHPQTGASPNETLADFLSGKDQ
jgi:ABC-2 type transport system ATP-binding protein